MEAPDIPYYEDPEFPEALTALVRSADFVSQIAVLLATTDDREGVLRRHAETLSTADSVIQAWKEHVGIDDK